MKHWTWEDWLAAPFLIGIIVMFFFGIYLLIGAVFTLLLICCVVAMLVVIVKQEGGDEQLKPCHLCDATLVLERQLADKDSYCAWCPECGACSGEGTKQEIIASCNNGELERP